MNNAAGSFNGGGPGQCNGGGASDVRLVNGAWNNFDSLKSRIMVAAGGGGTDRYIDTVDTGGAGGALTGFDSKYKHGKGAKQNAGGQGYVNGSFGKDGGGSSNEQTTYGGGGGSSFISGYPGCNAILATSTEKSIKHSEKTSPLLWFIVL